MEIAGTEARFLAKLNSCTAVGVLQQYIRGGKKPAPAQSSLLVYPGVGPALSDAVSSQQLARTAGRTLTTGPAVLALAPGNDLGQQRQPRPSVCVRKGRASYP